MLAPAEAPPFGFERKLSTSIHRLRANSMHHERAFTSGEPSKSQLGLRRLKSLHRRGARNLDNDEALFFLSLPDKVRRLHFTKQENILMRAACELQLSKNTGFENVFPPQKFQMDSRASSSHSYTSSFVARDAMLDHGSASLDEERSSAPSSITSFRPRTCSMVSSNGSILPFNPLACHPLERLHAQGLSQSPLDHTRIITKTADTPGATTRQYLDPKTRAMMRQMNASPKAFDEVLTFGFLAEGDDSVTESQKASNNGYSILSDDSFDEDDDFSTDTDDEFWTPGSDDTPATSWDYQSPFLPIQRRDSSCFRTQEREMTLRVTLTKPELKPANEETPTRPSKSEKQTQPVIKDDDPLALEELTFSDDVTGMYGAFAVTPIKERSKVKKLLEKLQRASTSPVF